ncbi:hypothetical protein KZP23_08370 [Echinicola marina]|uniref:hypothetical protein n=1 Tax=Echinicola marina TaxID=2859768 RepID=UPI001CF6251A|nr:hypothetical protein [Echinicola marina]UCS95009.1 hypothetical protein KZP23_08370 [Echinicola marina]
MMQWLLFVQYVSNLNNKVLLTIFMLFCCGVSLTAQEIHSGQSTLSIVDLGAEQFGLKLSRNGLLTVYEQHSPLAVEVVTSDTHSVYYYGAYTSMESLENGIYRCNGHLVSPNGSIFGFEDIYQKSTGNGIFEVNRTVTVKRVGKGDIGFSTQMAFQRSELSSMNDYDFFAPAIWYKENSYVSDNALAADLNENGFWFREDRMPMPVFMLYQKDNGATFSVFHKNADGETFLGEDGLPRIIDGRMKFAAMGMENSHQPLVGMVYPGTEGDRTGIWGMSSEERTALRAHPVELGYEQKYEMAFSLHHELDYPKALKNTWQKYYALSVPKLYEVDLSEVYNDQIGVLKRYWKEIKGTAGLPFRIKLNGQIESHLDYNFNMGFVGQQTGNAYLLIREGLNTEDDELLSKGEQMIKFWVDNGIMPSGIPRTWYDPYPQTWRNDYPTHMRVVGDGMSGILAAWNQERKNGRDKPEWLAACKKVADWLSTIQNKDGSFYQQYNFNTGALVNSSKNNTSNIIPFLVDLYFITGIQKYRQMVLRAGEFVFEDVYKNYKYAGGAADNPNITDKESASMALRAFLAIYDMEKQNKWLDAAQQTAHFYQTWVFSWEVPLPKNDPKMVFPNDREVTGLSQIATGNNGADTYAAIDAFNFYRLYLYSGDQQLLHFSKLLLRNTKQYMNWDDGDPIEGMAPGFLGEAVNVTIPRGHGVGFFLPWQIYNMLEPMILISDVFQIKGYDIETVESISELIKRERHQAYSDTHGLIKL